MTNYILMIISNVYGIGQKIIFKQISDRIFKYTYSYTYI